MALAMPWVHHTAAQSRKPKYVREYKDRHGVNRLEFRRKGIKGWPLRPPLRSDAFWEDYNAALAGGIPPGVASRGQRLPVATTGSMRWLCIGYKKSAAFKRLDITAENLPCIDLAADISFRPGDTIDAVHMTPRGARRVGDYICKKFLALIK